MSKPPNLKEIDDEVETLNRQKEEAVANQDFEQAAALRDQADKLKKKKQQITKEWREKSRENGGVVDEEVIAEVVSKMTGIPLTRMSTEDSMRLMQMEDELHKRVISQDEAIKAIARAVRRSRSGLQDPKRPTGTFVFAGPTGVGKTLLAKALAEFMFGDQEALIQIDMSEYMEKHNVSRLIGAPPGYVGYEEGGQLTEQIRRRPYAVVLLDEIEKAHPEVFNMLLQVMEEGRLTDSFGRNIDFRNTILIMTTNAGAEAIKNEAAFGFQKPDQDASYDSMKTRVTEEIEKVFRPEFVNRVNDIIVFRHLNDNDMKHVIDLELSKVRERMLEKGLTLVLTDEAKEFLVKKGTNLDFGARPLRRAIENVCRRPAGRGIAQGRIRRQEHDQGRRQESRRQEAAGVRQPDFQRSRSGPRAGRRWRRNGRRPRRFARTERLVSIRPQIEKPTEPATSSPALFLRLDRSRAEYLALLGMRGEPLKGHLDLLILAAVEAEPRHGYAVIEALREKSAGAFDLPEGTIYPALHRLGKGWPAWPAAGRSTKAAVAAPIGSQPPARRRCAAKPMSGRRFRRPSRLWWEPPHDRL